MVKVLFLTLDQEYSEITPHGSGEYKRILRYFNNDVVKKYQKTEDPEEAEIILFIQLLTPDYKRARKHSYVKQYLEKCFVWHSGDKVFPYLPGLYTSLEKPFHIKGWSKSSYYLSVACNDSIRHLGPIPDNAYLFSFFGRKNTHKVRREIFKLQDPGGFIVNSIDSSQSGLYLQDYLNSIKKSKFVLCPRGFGSSSFRLFEALKCGRVPVIISDNWVTPDDIPWEEISIRVSEKDVNLIPEILKAKEHIVNTMSEKGYAIWTEKFDLYHGFNTIIDWCVQIKEERIIDPKIMKSFIFLLKLKPFFISGLFKRKIIKPIHKLYIKR